ncbi:MAG: leucine--tRNA ligase [Lachnospiraceae bacterium]|nr:leucine--tRNA ligase [Ruminococcus sp.]MCM1274277.1 leucine--tRNA ligase [Lachnospiraceae bacterium]
MKYDFAAVESKWQKYWEEHRTFRADNDFSKPKYYALVEFPYPSGDGLHVGHPRPYTAMDIVARKRRMQGYNVLFPMGWDAFGLPTENYAIKNKIHPAIVTENNIKRFRGQLKMLGLSFDWEREVNTTDPNYFKWTQWIFLKLFKAGLAYKKEMNVNWCTSCKVVLANEEVVNGVCERCHGEVIHKVKNQWMLKITEYAQRLLDDLDSVDYFEKIKTAQVNWIGRSTGAEVTFETTAGDDLLIYTTRCDTLFGATYMVISPEHPLIEKWADKLGNMDAVREYQAAAARKSDFDRTEMNKDKTGVKLDGVRAINPVNGREIPIFISDYVLMSYGTGAIMAVPAHDTRDWEFAKKFDLPIIEVVKGGEDVQKEAFTDCATGILVNSDFLDGLPVEDAKKKMIEFLTEKGIGHEKVNFKLRDWVFSRQRYWGEPIPVVYCEKCGWQAVPEEELPLTLPDVESYMPTDNGESPLSTLESFINTTCPCCGGPAKRETDTMPQWAGSSWYFLRYTDPTNDKELASKEALKYWLPVDWYNGGMEHTTLHLLYSRFWHKFLYDEGVVPTKEPYAKRTSHGMILGKDPENPGKFCKMSKSLHNVVNPDEVIAEYGADTMRLYEMFVGDFEKAAPWQENGIKGCKRFLERIWNMSENLKDGDEYSEKLRSSMHKTVKKVSEDIETLKFNTAIAAMMGLLNEADEAGGFNRAEFRTLLILLDPFAPHIAEELFERLGFGILNEQKWAEYDEKLCVDSTVELAVQVNGKVKARFNAPVDSGKDELVAMALALPEIKALTEGRTIVKQIAVPGKLVNIVVK